jgi:hypothetical protein
MVKSHRVPGLVAGLTAVIAVLIVVTMIPVGAETPVARTQPVTVVNTPLPVTAAPAVSFDGFRDGFAIPEGGSEFVEFDALYVSLILVSGSDDDIVDLSFFYQDSIPRFTMSGAHITLPLTQPVALDAIGISCGLGSGECDVEVALLGTAAA